MYDRNRFAPITLTVEGPVLHFELNALFTCAGFCELFDHSINRVSLLCISVKEIRVDHFTVACICFNGDIASLDYFNYINTELLGKLIVSLVMRRNCHNCACAVTHHYVVRNVNRNFLTVYRVDTYKTIYAHTCFILNKLSSLKFCLFCALRSISLDSIHIADLISILIKDGMLGSNYHKCYTKKCIRSGCIDHKLFIKILKTKLNESAC